ncbi:hypothetical protein AALO_G00082240 [Alosa alosa]|uniref:Uncharacterized protein n=1 Tax=Alosa alosa TaxID=278164 RepID=A0AAV6GXZ5_9TELE|nr:hypothetical protein AALO_G00082240 [Alosa alosa]
MEGVGRYLVNSCDVEVLGESARWRRVGERSLFALSGLLRQWLRRSTPESDTAQRRKLHNSRYKSRCVNIIFSSETVMEELFSCSRSTFSLVRKP